MIEQGHEGHLTVFGATWCSDCKRAKKFLGAQRVHYDWVDVEQDSQGLALVEQVNNGKRIIPTIVFEDRSILAEPGDARLGSTKQAASAVGEGTTAALMIREYLKTV